MLETVLNLGRSASARSHAPPFTELQHLTPRSSTSGFTSSSQEPSVLLNS